MPNEDKPKVTVEENRLVKVYDEHGRIHAEFESTDGMVMIRQKGQQGRARGPVALAQLEEAIAALKR
jgi:hypothetical protein